MAKTEQPPLYMIRRGDRLLPEMATDRELLDLYPEGERIKVSLHTGRSPAKLRWYWAYLARIVSATGCSPSKEVLHDVIKLHTGFVEPVMVKGFPVAVPKSISFGKMSELEFDAFLKNAVAWIAETYDITPEQVFGGTSNEAA